MDPLLPFLDHQNLGMLQVQQAELTNSSACTGDDAPAATGALCEHQQPQPARQRQSRRRRIANLVPPAANPPVAQTPGRGIWQSAASLIGDRRKRRQAALCAPPAPGPREAVRGAGHGSGRCPGQGPNLRRPTFSDACMSIVLQRPVVRGKDRAFDSPSSARPGPGRAPQGAARGRRAGQRSAGRDRPGGRRGDPAELAGRTPGCPQPAGRRGSR